MRQHLAEEKLKSGETMAVECVTAPDDEFKDRITPFLAHKPENYRGHIDQAFAGACDELETRFYIGLLGDEVVGNIMTVEWGGIGVFGHVQTAVPHRRKGICSAIMRHQMEDFRRRDGHVLLLGTGYQSAPYYIYHSYGFEDWPQGRPGLMRYDAGGDMGFPARFLEAEGGAPRSASWKHWPLAALLASEPGEPWLRSVEFDLRGVGLLEGPFSKYLYERLDQPRALVSVVEAANGAVVAVATCKPDSRWRGDTLILDLFAYPTVTPESLAGLIRSMDLPSGRIDSFTDAAETKVSTALELSGFHRESTLRRYLRDGDARRDVWHYTRISE